MVVTKFLNGEESPFLKIESLFWGLPGMEAERAQNRLTCFVWRLRCC